MEFLSDCSGIYGSESKISQRVCFSGGVEEDVDLDHHTESSKAGSAENEHLDVARKEERTRNEKEGAEDHCTYLKKKVSGRPGRRRRQGPRVKRAYSLGGATKGQNQKKGNVSGSDTVNRPEGAASGQPTIQRRNRGDEKNQSRGGGPCRAGRISSLGGLPDTT